MYMYLIVMITFAVNYRGKVGHMFERMCLTDFVPWDTMRNGCYDKSQLWKYIDEKTFPFSKTQVTRMDGWVCSSGLCNDAPLDSSNYCGAKNTGSSSSSSDSDDAGELSAGKESSGVEPVFAQHSQTITMLLASTLSILGCVFF